MPMTKVYKYELGQYAKDKITGFSGVISHLYSALTGCDQYGIMPTQLDKDGKRRDAEFFDESRIELTGGKLDLNQSTSGNGCDEPPPTSR